MKTLKIAI